MKKILTLSLALMVVLGLTLTAVACGGEEATSDETTVETVDDSTVSTEASDATDSGIPADAVYWEDAESVEDEVATVYGEAMEITNAFERIQVPKILVRVGSMEAERHYFNLVVTTDDQGVPNVPGVDMATIESWIGKTVVMTGKVTFNGFEPNPTWEIIITDGSDVVVVE